MSPLAWQMTEGPVTSPPDSGPPGARRHTDEAPRGVILIDTREQCPFDFHVLQDGLAELRRELLAVGDYTIAGLEHRCILERKDSSDLAHSFPVKRSAFIDRLRRMNSCPLAQDHFLCPSSRIRLILGGSFGKSPEITFRLVISIHIECSRKTCRKSGNESSSRPDKKSVTARP